MSTRIIIGDCREKLLELPDASVHCCVTSPPYFGLRDYGVDGQMGLEPTPDEFVDGMVDVFREVRRVLRDDGTLWLNIGDTYAGGGVGGGGSFASERANWRVVPERKGQRAAVQGCKAKDLVGIPWLLAFALRADGWFLRQDIIWSKPNPMPESVQDRCTKAHEYLFLLAKRERYYFDQEATKETSVSDHASGNGFEGRQGGSKHMPMSGGAGTVEQWMPGGKRNRRSVWTIATQAFKEAHFATFPPALIEPCILAGCPVGGTVLDPFFGAGTTGLVADRLQRNCVGIELNPEYAEIAKRRIEGDSTLFAEVAAA